MSRDQVNHFCRSWSNGGHCLGPGHHLCPTSISNGGGGESRLPGLPNKLIQLGFALHLKSDLWLSARLPGPQQTGMTAGRLLVGVQDSMAALSSSLSLTLRTANGGYKRTFVVNKATLEQFMGLKGYHINVRANQDDHFAVPQLFGR